MHVYRSRCDLPEVVSGKEDIVRTREDAGWRKTKRWSGCRASRDQPVVRRLPFSVRASRIRRLIVPGTLFASDIEQVTYLYLWI